MLDPVTLMVIPGFVGGVVIALVVLGLNRRAHARAASGPFTNEPLSTDVINMASIRVAGIGGLGLVAMATVVAFALPSIGQSLAIGLVLGGVIAASLILWRQHAGPMPSSGERPGANTTLSIDQAQPPPERPPRVKP